MSSNSGKASAAGNKNTVAYGSSHGHGRLTADALRHVPTATKEEYTSTKDDPFYDKASMDNRKQHYSELQRQIKDVDSLLARRG